MTSSDGASTAADSATAGAIPPGNGASAGTEPVEAEPGTAAGAETETGPLGFTPPPPMCQLLFVDVSLVLPSTHPVVVLQEAEWPYRELRIPVGGAEGVAIGYAARRVPTPRPLTHQMVSDLLDTFELTLDQVRITAVHGSNFVAELVVSGRLGVRTIDCRPSDAIALALRRPIPVPIMASPEVLDAAGAAAAGAN
ncbi:MAG TPA: bifunctional nuclease family protein [Acidimicrobiales bacterium]|nr:bifunctional nuclease family protein [Acidimicrobiales bacterium]